MHLIKASAAATAAILLCAQPCLAADDFRSLGATERRSGAFAGMTVRMPLDRQRAKPTARLQLTTVHQSYDRSSGLSGRTIMPAGLELGLGRSAKPTLFVGGRSTADIEEKLHVKGSSGTTILIVGGVLLLAVVVLASVADAQPTAGPGEGAFD